MVPPPQSMTTELRSTPEHEYWSGNLAYPLRPLPGQEITRPTLHFPVHAAGAIHHRIGTRHWPADLTDWGAFRQVQKHLAIPLYDLDMPVPWGEISIHPNHSELELLRWDMFRQVLSRWFVFYVFPPSPVWGPAQGARGLMFFTLVQAPGDVFFRAFVDVPFPAWLRITSVGQTPRRALAHHPAPPGQPQQEVNDNEGGRGRRRRRGERRQ